MDILIGIPVLDQMAITGVCLQSLIDHARTDDRHLNVSVVVIDNGSREDVAPLVQRARGAGRLPVHLVRNSVNRGVAAAWNQILRFSPDGTDAKPFPFPYCVIANNDVMFGPDWLPPLVKAMEDNPRIGWISSMENGSPPAPELREAHVLSRRHRLDPCGPHGEEEIRESIRRVYDRWGGHDAFCRLIQGKGLPAFIPFEREKRSAVCFMIRTAMVEQIGFFDESFPPIGIAEDLEYFLRMERRMLPPWLGPDAYPEKDKWLCGFCGQSIVHHNWCSTRQGRHFDGRQWDRIREKNWRTKFGRSRKECSRLFG